MDELLSAAAAKLANTEHPIAVPRHKYMLASLQQEALRLERALKDGELAVVQGAFNFPRWVPGWLARSLAWMAKPFLGARLKRQDVSENVVRAKLDELKDSTAKLGAEMVTGILTPLNLSDEAECNAHYYKTLRHLETALPAETTEDAITARQEAITLTSSAYLNAKRVECALKRRTTDGRFERILTAKQAHTLDPRVVAEIWGEYVQNFILTEDELGKSAAPSPAGLATSRN